MMSDITKKLFHMRRYDNVIYEAKKKHRPSSGSPNQSGSKGGVAETAKESTNLT